MNPDSFYKQIGLRIQERRENQGRVQKELAGRLAISRGSLANIETGRQRIMVHQLYRIAAELELSPTDLLPPMPAKQIDEPQINIPVPSHLNPQQAKDVANFYSRVNTGRNPKKEEPHVTNIKR